MNVDEVASIVIHREGPEFVSLLKSASSCFEQTDFESQLAAHLTTRPGLVEQWSVWSGDQRWTPSAYLDGTKAGWHDAGPQHIRQHPDRAAATADFIHRMAVWLADRRVLASE
jgi:hypothetical protein